MKKELTEVWGKGAENVEIPDGAKKEVLLSVGKDVMSRLDAEAKRKAEVFMVIRTNGP